MKPKALILLPLLVVLFSGLRAQDSTKVRFFVKASDIYYIRHHDRVLPLSNVQMFEPGIHDIEIWSPRYRLHTTTIEVPPTDSINVIAELEMDRHYRDYLFAMENYKRKQFWMGTAPAVLFCLGTVGTVALYRPLKDANEERVKEEFANTYSPGAENSEAATSFARLSAAMGLSIGTQVASAIWFVALRNKVKALERPTYRQQNPFTLDYFEITYNTRYRVPQAGLTLSF